MSTPDQPKGILRKMAEIQRGIHGAGIAKSRRNQEQKFNFRGIDDAVAALAPLLSEFGVMVLPRYKSITIDPRQTKSGGTTYNVRLEGEFLWVDTDDGSERLVGPFYGEANDGQDKAISKATSVAYRNMVFLTLCAPHEGVIGGDPDGAGEDAADRARVVVNEWLQSIAGATSLADLQAVKVDCVRSYGQPDNVPASLKHAFVARTKALQPQQAAA